MKRKAITVMLASLLFLAFGLVEAQEPNLIFSASCPEAVSGEIDPVVAAAGFSVDILIDNTGLEDFIGGSFSLMFYSPDGDITTVTHDESFTGDKLPDCQSIEPLNGWESKFMVTAIVKFSWDGTLPDTINICPISIMYPGIVPSDPNQEYLRFHLKVEDQDGMICIDSVKPSENGHTTDYDWLFLPDNIPVFNGPYCWMIGEAVLDTVPPEITCPDDITINCGESTDPSNTGYAIAFDSIDYDVDIEYLDVCDSLGDCPVTITRTWTATDDAMNSSECVQMIYQIPFNESNLLFSAACPEAVEGVINPAMAAAGFSVDILIDNVGLEDWIGGGFSFRFYSPDGGITTISHGDSAIEYLNGWDMMFMMTMEVGLDWDGTLPEDYNLVPMSIMYPGLTPSEPNQEYIRFNFSTEQVGEFCIDSIQPSNEGYGTTDYDWLFVPENRPVTFSGPYCWEIGSEPSDGWRATIHAEGEYVEGAVNEADVIIGVEEFEDVTSSPPPPPEYTVMMQTYQPDFDGPYYCDVRQQGDESYYWMVEINPHGNVPPPIERCATLSWDPSEFSPDFKYFMKEGYDGYGDMVVEDMRTTTEYEVCGIGPVCFTVHWSPIECVNVDLNAGWNLVSLPLTPESPSVSSLFPNALAVFGYDGAYYQATEMEPCEGYWVKAPESETVEICGQMVYDCSGPANYGWNLIGGPNCVTTPESDPPIELLALFGFDGSYAPVTDFQPTEGYWAKLNSACDLLLDCDKETGIISSPEVVSRIEQSYWRATIYAEGENVGSATYQFDVEIGIEDAEDFYVAPPLPPEYTTSLQLDELDWTGAYYRAVYLEGGEEYYWIVDINPHGSVMPPTPRCATLSWDVVDFGPGEYSLIEGFEVGGTVVVSDMTTTTEYEVCGGNSSQYYLIKFIPSTGTDISENDLPLIPDDYTLMQNYPNPFNPITNIELALPIASDWNVTIYNIAGQVVEAFNGHHEAGYVRVTWDATDQASGIYFYKAKAGEFTSAKKMLLLK